MTAGAGPAAGEILFNDLVARHLPDRHFSTKSSGANSCK
jgi:hypothetical protein